MYKDNYCWYVQVCSNVHQRSEQSKIKSKKFVSIQSSSFKSNLQSQSNISKRILIKSNPQSNPNYRGLVQFFCLTWFTWKKYFIFYSGQQLIMICCSTSLGFSKCEGYGLDWQSNPSTTIPRSLKDDLQSKSKSKIERILDFFNHPIQSFQPLMNGPPLSYKV